MPKKGTEKYSSYYMGGYISKSIYIAPHDILKYFQK